MEKENSRLGTLIQLSREESAEDDKVGASQFANVTSLSDEQSVAYKAILQWYSEARRLGPRGRAPLKTLGGLAGTGKTTLLGVLAADLCRQYKIAFCTLTGKAATILARSLSANGALFEYCGTIHRLMYQPLTDPDTGEVVGWGKAPTLEYDLIVVDEGSMMSESILDDMLGYGVPTLIVGDHGQLPPVGEDAGIMKSPDIRLETVHRQALDSPIIVLSQLIRHGGDWRGFVRNSGDPRVSHVDAMDMTALVMEKFAGFRERPFSEDPLILCGTNRTRNMLNQAVRLQLRTDEVLVENERIICLKNQRLSGLLLANGFRGRVKKFGYSPNPMMVCASVVFPDESLELRYGMLSKPQFGADHTFKSFLAVSPHYRSWSQVGLLFDYGYALTVHKAQGSQADSAILCVEQFGSKEDFGRWVYTGVTRASQELTVVF